MKNIVRLYRFMLKHWGYMIAGLFFMFGFAFFSGISITMAIPFFDYIFTDNTKIIIYKTFPHFSQALQKVLVDFTSRNHKLTSIFNKDVYKPLADQLDNVMARTDPMLLLWIIGISVITLIVLKNIFFYGKRVMFANLRGRTVKDIRNAMFHKYLYQSLRFFGKNKVGDSLVRMVSDLKIVSDMFIKAIFSAMQDLLLLVVNTIIALLINPKLFLISMVLFPLFSYIIGFLGKKIKKYSKRIQGQSSEMFSNVEETLTSMRIVKGFAREDYEMEKFDAINNRHFKFWRKSILYKAVNVPLSELNSAIMGIIVMIVGGSQVLAPNSDFSPGLFMTFLLALFSMLHPVKKVTTAYAEIRKAMVSLDRISEILERTSEIEEKKNAISKHEFNDTIQFKEVSFSYDEDKDVLKSVSFEVKKGEKVAIIGSSGSGKTTCVNLLPRMYDRTSGQILIDGIPIEDIKLKDLRTLFGTVTQESILFSDTIANNIRYGSLNELTEAELIKASEIAYADEFINEMPLKLEQKLDTKASNLSGGQKQRLCIARAIVGDPPILIFDEATSSLDTEAEQKVQKAIEMATRDRTVIMIAHRLSTILASDKIIVLDQGKIVGIGKHEELIQTCEKYKLLYNLQFNG
ncbi:ABC transporter ATP-binding protein [Candidatus Cloacimonadota bacterium]